jgi:hypothetical protein
MDGRSLEVIRYFTVQIDLPIPAIGLGWCTTSLIFHYKYKYEYDYGILKQPAAFFDDAETCSDEGPRALFRQIPDRFFLF